MLFDVYYYIIFELRIINVAMLYLRRISFSLVEGAFSLSIFSLSRI